MDIGSQAHKVSEPPVVPTLLVSGATSGEPRVTYPNVVVGTLPTAKSGILGGPELPGHGRPYGDCGDLMLLMCPECGYLKERKRNCRRATCPKCYTTWAWLQASKSSLRIKETRVIFRRELGRSRRPIHVTISLPRKAWDLHVEDYPRVRRKAYKLLKEAGMRAGLLIDHPWRQNCVRCGGSIVGSWSVDLETGKFVQKSRYCEDCGGTEFEWKFSPHFHVVGYGWIVHTKEIEARTGYVIKKISTIKNLGGTIWYQLTHCGIRAGRQTVTYFGLSSLNKFKAPKLEIIGIEKCPHCGTRLREVQPYSPESPQPRPPWPRP